MTKKINERLFKVLDDNGHPHHGGNGHWHLPHDGKPGDWMPPIKGNLVACQNGYHLCREGDLIEWLGPNIFEAECQGERLDTATQIIVREARLLHHLENWNDCNARLFACDCAEHVLPLYENQRAGDNRPRRAIEIARQYARGKATRDELDAAWHAAFDATWGADGAAADAATSAADDWAAAWHAARHTVRDAAKVADSDAEQEWQTERLMDYLYPKKTI